MPLTSNEVEAIHKEIEAESKAITRFGILRATALLLLTIAFAQAFQRLTTSRPDIDTLTLEIDEQVRVRRLLLCLASHTE